MIINKQIDIKGYLGNRNILDNSKIGFLCSRKIPASIILKTYDWAIKQRDEGKCIISGFHSKIEKDVFEILLKGTQPIIMVLARGLKKSWSKDIIEAMNFNRLLIIAPFDINIKRVTSSQAKIRNELILDISEQIFIPYINPNGSLSSFLLNNRHKIVSI